MRETHAKEDTICTSIRAPGGAERNEWMTPRCFWCVSVVHILIKFSRVALFSDRKGLMGDAF